MCRAHAYIDTSNLNSFPVLTLVLLNQICTAFANSVDPDQLASEAN